MATHGSANVRETPHVNRTNTIGNALKQRAQAVLNDRTIDPQSKAIIRYAMEVNDPWLAELVRRADAGNLVVDAIDFSETPPASQPCEDKIEALANIICQAGDEAAVALLVLMLTIENSSHPKALANQAKHLVFTRCGKQNLYDMVDAQIALLEGELFARNASE